MAVFTCRGPEAQVARQVARQVQGVLNVSCCLGVVRAAAAQGEGREFRVASRAGISYV